MDYYYHKFDDLQHRIRCISEGYCLPSHLKFNYRKLLLYTFESLKGDFLKSLYQTIAEDIITEIDGLLKSEIIKHNYYYLKANKFSNGESEVYIVEDESDLFLERKLVVDSEDIIQKTEDCLKKELLEIKEELKNFISSDNYPENPSDVKTIKTTSFQNESCLMQSNKSNKAVSEQTEQSKIKIIATSKTLKNNIKYLLQYRDYNGVSLFRDYDDDDTAFQLEYFFKNGIQSELKPKVLFHIGTSYQILNYLFGRLAQENLIIKQYQSAIVNSGLFRNSEGKEVLLDSLKTANTICLKAINKNEIPLRFEKQFEKINVLIKTLKSNTNKTCKKLT